MKAILRAALYSTLLAAAACTTPQEAPQGAQAQSVTSTPSPRPECATAHVTIYFSDEVQSDQPVATPLLQDLLNQVHACEQAGGQLRGIEIVTAADPGQSTRDGQAQIERRTNRVRDALVHLGAPANKIHGAETPVGEDAVMSSRAEVTADLY